MKKNPQQRYFVNINPRNKKSITGKISSGIRNSGAMVDYLQGKETFFFAKYKKKNMENLSEIVTEKAIWFNNYRGLRQLFILLMINNQFKN